VAAPAEKTGLASATFDAITVAQAFHWFDAPAARAEFRRLLRPGGWVYLIWNHRQVDTNAFARAYEDLLRSLGKAYETVVRRDQVSGPRSRENFFTASSSRVARYDNPQTMDWPSLRGRFLSSSYVPAKGEPRHDEMLARLEEIFHAHSGAGRVTFDQVTEVFYGQLD
jgi:SAM-dependent methyltransferase